MARLYMHIDLINLQFCLIRMTISLVESILLVLAISTTVNTQNVFPSFPINLPFQQSFIQPGSLQFPSSVSSTSPSKKLGRIGLFTDVFYKTVQASPQLLQVFDVSYPSSEASLNIYRACNNSLTLAGVAYPESLAKDVADALYLTFPFMTRKDFIYTISDSVATYLLAQSQLTSDNPSSYAVDFADTILNSYPGTGEPIDHYTLIRSFSNGAVDFLKSKEAFSSDRAPALPLELALNFFAMSDIQKPSIQVSVVAPPGTRPSSYTVFGISAFSNNFFSAVDSSTLLQSLFYVDKSATFVGTAWRDAIREFCDLIKCLFPFATSNYIPEAMSLTYENMSKRVFTRCVAQAYALTLVSMGKMVPENAARDAQTVATTIQNGLSQLLPNADLKERVGAYLNAFKSLNGDDAGFVNQFAIHIYYIGNGMYANSYTKKRRYS